MDRGMNYPDHLTHEMAQRQDMPMQSAMRRKRIFLKVKIRMQ